MPKDTADYEASEEVAIASGKKALERAPWLFNRRVDKAKGFFAELRENPLNTNYYSVFLVDGNGTKLFLSAWSNNYRQGPTDGVAMSANDLATLIHGIPDSINIYMACQTEVEEKHMGEIMDGFVDALERIKIPDVQWDLNIGKMETASLDEMISLGVPNKGVDFGIVMTGYIDKKKVPNLDPKPGNSIVGVSSSGLHSNGYTGARHALFTSDFEYREEWKSQYKGRFKLDDKPEILEGKTILEAMQVPTALYLVEAALVGKEFDSKDIYGVNITGNGLHNFNRVGEGVSFEITDALEPLPIHKLLMEESGWDAHTAYKKQNMGMGFAYIVPTQDIAERVVQLINEQGESEQGKNTAKIVGKVEASDEEDLRTTIHNPLGQKGKEDFIGYTS
ncbi:hypothetical protein GOV06_02465 [Candidatus Woesearchaeota archaeon]|nr:hypothetical protein [Candidatus Woesearchaeota archaeon]